MLKKEKAKAISFSEFYNLEEKKENFTGIVYSSIVNKRFFIHHVVNNEIHREDGPARIFSNGAKYYYINGLSVTKEQQEFYYDLLKLKNLV